MLLRLHLLLFTPHTHTGTSKLSLFLYHAHTLTQTFQYWPFYSNILTYNYKFHWNSLIFIHIHSYHYSLTPLFTHTLTHTCIHTPMHTHTLKRTRSNTLSNIGSRLSSQVDDFQSNCWVQKVRTLPTSFQTSKQRLTPELATPPPFWGQCHENTTCVK